MSHNQGGSPRHRDASYTWYEVRRCMIDCCIGRENIVEVRSPAVQQPYTYTVDCWDKR